MQTKLFDGVKEGVKEGSKKPIEITDVAMNTLKDSTQWHKSHRYLFLYSFSGPQPTRGSSSLAKIGRYKTIPQARFEFPEYKAIAFTLPRTLKIWVKHPSGAKTAEQLVEARRIAREVAGIMARKHDLSDLREREAGFSEHTVERKALDSLIRPVISAEPELAKERLGLSVNQTSHQGRVEWTGKNAKDRVMQLERWLDGREFEEMRGAMREMAGSMRELVSIIKGEMVKPPENGRGNEYL